MSKPPRKSLSRKTIMRLQREVGSKCPFCYSEETEYFEVHHIDEDPSHNDESNLLLLCPTCHSKITKGDIAFAEVQSIKGKLPRNSDLVEFASVTVDSNRCDWEVSPINQYAFLRGENNKKHPFPIFKFTLINQSRNTVVLKTIRLQVKKLPSGIHGWQGARVLRPLITYQMQIEGKNNVLHLNNPIEVMGGVAFMFQVELFEKFSQEPGRFEIQGRMVLSFAFEFSNGLSIHAPNICLNCQSENETLKITYLH